MEAFHRCTGTKVSVFVLLNSKAVSGICLLNISLNTACVHTPIWSKYSVFSSIHALKQTSKIATNERVKQLYSAFSLSWNLEKPQSAHMT